MTRAEQLIYEGEFAECLLLGADAMDARRSAMRAVNGEGAAVEDEDWAWGDDDDI